MPVINGIYLKDFTALPSAVTDANIIPIAIAGNQVAYRTTVGGIITDARITGKLLTGLSVTGGAVVSTDTILQAFGKVQNQLNNRVSSVGLTMPLAFSVANSPVTGSGTLAVTANGLASQYIRGDGQLADFPTGGGGGGSSVSYYLNGSVNQGTFVGNTYYEMNKVPVFGAGTDFSIGADGYIAQFLTDANDPNSLLIPAGNWNFETYFSASSGGGTPSFYVELYKYSGTTFTLIATNSSSPELIAFGTTINPYFSALAVPETVLLATDRLAIRIYVTHSGRTITLHTENSHLCQIITTFTTGLQSLNGLTKQTQYFAVGTSGTDFNISSSVDTHTFNIPSASASNRGLITTGTQTIAGAKTFALDTNVNGVTIGRGGSNISSNTKVGTNSLSSNTTGSFNSAFGFSSLGLNTTGSSNTGHGYYSLAENVSGSNNTAIGLSAIEKNTTGSNNIGLGVNAGRGTISALNVITNNSIFIGAFTLASANNQTNQIVIGHEAVGLGSNTTVLGNSSTLSTAIWGDLLIGSTVDNGTDKLQVTGAVNITGQLKLGSTITNNTFTYTLPSATGTLALGTGVAGQVAFWNGTNTQTGDSGLVWDNVNKRLGIGTTTPTQALEVVGVSRLRSGIEVFNNSRILNVNAGGAIRFNANASISITNSNDIEYVRFNGSSSNGSVLINTTTDAGFRLDVNGTARVTGQLTLGSTITNGIFTYTLPSATGTIALTSNLSAYLPLAGGTLTGQLNGTRGIFSGDVQGGRLYSSQNDALIQANDSRTSGGSAIIRAFSGTNYADFYMSNANGSTLTIATNGVNKLFIDNSGNVGIGTPNPTAKLEVLAGGIRWGNGTIIGELGYSSRVEIGTVSNHNVGFTTNGVTQMLINTSGNVGIGTTSPSTKLQIEGTGVGAWLTINRLDSGSNIVDFTQSGSRLGYVGFNGNDLLINNSFASNTILYSNNLERIRITSGGNVLIGTTTDNGAKFRSSGGAVHLEGNGAFLTLNSTNSNTFKVILQDSGTVRSYLGASDTNAFVVGSNSGSTIATINNSTGAYTALSDINKKKDIEESQIGLNAILGLKPTLYRMKTDANNTDKHLGFIAQEVKEFIPQAYKENGDFIGLDYNPIIATLVKAIQELNEKIIQLENK